MRHKSSGLRDLDIRKALRKHLKAAHESESDTLIMDELGLCQGSARVDLAVVNGSLNGYEIKSERDTLQRLPAQQAVYNRALDRVTVVASPSHVEPVKDLVPSWWAIWSVVGQGSSIRFKAIRSGSTNPNVDSGAIVQLLWRDEAMELLRQEGLDRGMSGKPRRTLWHRLAEHHTGDELRELVRQTLKSRRNWRSDL